jgi:hypothetical protein
MIFVSLPCVCCVIELIRSPKATYYANFSNLLLPLLHPIVENRFVRSSVREIKVSHSQAKKRQKCALLFLIFKFFYKATEASSWVI